MKEQQEQQQQEQAKVSPRREAQPSSGEPSRQTLCVAQRPQTTARSWIYMTTPSWGEGGTPAWCKVRNLQPHDMKSIMEKYREEEDGGAVYASETLEDKMCPDESNAGKKPLLEWDQYGRSEDGMNSFERSLSTKVMVILDEEEVAHDGEQYHGECYASSCTGIESWWHVKPPVPWHHLSQQKQ